MDWYQSGEGGDCPKHENGREDRDNGERCHKQAGRGVGAPGEHSNRSDDRPCDRSGGNRAIRGLKVAVAKGPKIRSDISGVSRRFLFPGKLAGLLLAVPDPGSG